MENLTLDCVGLSDWGLDKGERNDFDRRRPAGDAFLVSMDELSYVLKLRLLGGLAEFGERRDFLGEVSDIPLGVAISEDLAKLVLIARGVTTELEGTRTLVGVEGGGFGSDFSIPFSHSCIFN